MGPKIEFPKFLHRLSPEVRYILSLFLITRIGLTLVGVLSRIMLAPYYGSNYVWVYSKHLWLDIWGVWDSGWYLAIANNWYPKVTGSAWVLKEGKYAFFPLYPLLMRILGTLTGTYVAGLIISNISLIVACIFLYKLVNLKSDKKTALRSVKYLFLFPIAFVLSGVFTESLFLALVITSFYYSKKRNWILVGVLGFFAALTRSLGVFLLLPFLYEYLRSKDFKLGKVSLDFLPLFFIPLGLSLFSLYNYHLTGDFLAFVHIQAAWNLRAINPLVALSYLVFSRTYHVFFSGIFTFVSILALLAFFRKIDFSYWLFGILAIFVPLSAAPIPLCMPRYILAAFPLFIILSRMGTEHRRDQLLTIFLVLLQGFLMILWSNGVPIVI